MNTIFFLSNITHLILFQFLTFVMDVRGVVGVLQKKIKIEMLYSILYVYNLFHPPLNCVELLIPIFTLTIFFFIKKCLQWESNIHPHPQAINGTLNHWTIYCYL